LSIHFFKTILTIVLATRSIQIRDPLLFSGNSLATEFSLAYSTTLEGGADALPAAKRYAGGGGNGAQASVPYRYFGGWQIIFMWKLL
jgi:hypothetical protein